MPSSRTGDTSASGSPPSTLPPASAEPGHGRGEEPTHWRSEWVGAKIALAIGVAVAVGALSWWLRDHLSLDRLVAWEQPLRDWQRTHPWRVFAAAFFIYVAVTGMSLPGATPLSLAYGWFFGFLPAVILLSFASTGGATLAFLSSRYLLRDAVQRRFGKRLESVDRAIRREGISYLLTARLIPGIPFVVINLVMGLTPIRVGTFWWASQLGMLPGTMLFAWAGAAFPDPRTLAEQGVESVLTPELIAAFLCLALFPLLVTKLRKRFSRHHLGRRR